MPSSPSSQCDTHHTWCPCGLQRACPLRGTNQMDMSIWHTCKLFKSCLQSACIQLAWQFALYFILNTLSPPTIPAIWKRTDVYQLCSLALQNVTVIHNHLLLWDKQKPKTFHLPLLAVAVWGLRLELGKSKPRGDVKEETRWNCFSSLWTLFKYWTKLENPFYLMSRGIPCVLAA